MTHAALFVSLILGFTPAPPPTQACSLNGLWLGQERNKEAVGMWLEFAPDGSVVRANGRIVDGDYALKNDNLILTTNATVASASGGPVRGELSQRVVLKIVGTEMIRKADAAIFEVAREEGNPDRRGNRRSQNPNVATTPIPAIPVLEETKLTKVVEGDTSEPLSGVWAWKNSAGRVVFERFTGKKRFAVLELIGGQRGTFKLEDNKLSVSADGSTTAVNILCQPNAFELDVPGAKLRFVKFQ